MPSGENRRVVSGMRPTGQLHLGHYHGVLKNWLDLQHTYECFFFVADWHALTTEYEDPSIISESVWEMVTDWLAVGIDPGSTKLFLQSRVPEHAELHLLLSMCTPMSWLERVPSYKDQQEKLSAKDLSTYGFLGYPLLQSADIMMYKGSYVPVGEDQLAHIELTREVVRRFNHLYGKESGFETKAKAAAKKMGRKNDRLYHALRVRYQEKGDAQALEQAKALLEAQQNISMGDSERLYGYLEGNSRIIFPEPQALLTPTPKTPGLDGQKMSKSYNNTLSLRENPSLLAEKLKAMPTDPARIRLTDPGDPQKCPVWGLHRLYSDDTVQDWVKKGCTTASIGCLECKQQVIDAILKEQRVIRERIKEYQQDPEIVKGIINEGCEAARAVARETLEEVRQVMGLDGY